jgi:nitronate monooxygenase
VAGEVSTLVLVPRVVDAVAPTPVAAAGGIADARGVVAALALGAQAAVLGTRFLASTESRAHPRYKEAGSGFNVSGRGAEMQAGTSGIYA